MASQRDDKRNRRRRQKNLYPKLALAGVILVLTAVMLFVLSRRSEPAPGESTEGSTAATEATTVIHIAAAGDLNVTENVIASGKTNAGFDFANAFVDVAPLLGGADLTVLNFEGVLAGEPYGQDGSAPAELAKMLKNLGVDMVQTANSASIRRGLLGLQATLNGLREQKLEPLGTYSSNADFRARQGYVIREVNGIRIAFVAFTKGMDNLGLPQGSENCVNVLYTDYASTYREIDTARIQTVLRAAQRETPDITIAMVHWGSEYNDQVSSSQKKIRDLMLSGGVDVILGTHPHLVQSVDFDAEAGTLVAYSLGDFFGDAQQPGSAYSLVLDLEITKDNTTGKTSVTSWSYTPIYTIQGQDSFSGKLQVVRLREAVALYESNFIGSVPESVYKNMRTALTRIEARLNATVE